MTKEIAQTQTSKLRRHASRTAMLRIGYGTGRPPLSEYGSAICPVARRVSGVRARAPQEEREVKLERGLRFSNSFATLIHKYI
ncbi:MAG: hypothetical protein WDZ90_02635 [Candidatus Paceibacterota bacterium]